MRSNKASFKPMKRQQGVVLFTALMFMIVLTMLAISSMSNNTMTIKMAGNAQETTYAYQAAQSALDMGWDRFSKTFNTDLVTLNDFDGNQTTVSYTGSEQQTTISGRCSENNVEQCQDGSAGFIHYDLVSTSTTLLGLQTIVHTGAKIPAASNE
jgi:Tfp pilus assembly protein PilX